MNKHKSILLFFSVISLVILFLFFLKQKDIKHGFIANYTKDNIQDIKITLEDGHEVCIDKILPNDAIIFSKINWLLTQKIKSIKILDSVITNFNTSCYLKNTYTVNFLRKDTSEEVYGISIFSGDIPKLNKLVCVNFSKWILPVVGATRVNGEYVQFFSFPLSNDIKIYDLQNSETIYQMVIIDLYKIFKKTAIQQRNEHGPGGPNAVVGVEIGDSLAKTIIGYLLKLSLLLFIFLRILFFLF